MAVTFALAIALAAVPELQAPTLPHLLPIAPETAPGTIRVKKGFRLELAAAEPLVADPVAMAFDENGRLFVAEMRDYPLHRDDGIGRIKLLVDTDGDGRFDRATVFADGLSWPTAVMWAKGGLFVGATPDILFLEDTDGDGKADRRKVLFTGFASTAPTPNVQGLMNSLVWGLDNRIHGASSGNGGEVRSLVDPGARLLDLRGKDFVIDPRTLAMTAENGGGQHGLSFDDWGHKFVCNNAHHIMAFTYDAHYVGLNPHFSLPPARIDIPVDGPAAEVYRISDEEPWRVLRTSWRAAGVYAGPVEGGGRASGYFTAASGVTIYRGSAFGSDFVGDAFIAEPAGNLIHRKKVRPSGPILVAARPADEQRTEFVASTDGWFRPVQFANAPDGTLYVADMYREIVEHPTTLPDSIKKQFDLFNGNDRGRIWRLVPDGFRQPPPVRLGPASTAVLVKTLGHPNGWHRDTAARLLYERQDRTAIPRLTELQRRAASPLGRLHALYALDGLGALTESHLVRAFSDRDAGVREHALRLSERFLSSAKIWSRVAALADDPAINVRYQLAFTLGLVSRPDKTRALLAIVRRDMEHEWSRAAVLNALTAGVGDVFAAISDAEQRRESAAGSAFLRQLAALVGARNDRAEVARVVAFIEGTARTSLAFALARSLSDGLSRAGSSVAKAGIQLTSLLTKARQLVADHEAAEATRLRAVELFALAPYPDAAATLLPLLDSAQVEPVQLAALSTLDRFTTAAALAPALLERMTRLTPRPRREAIGILVKRPDRAMALLSSVSAGTLSRSELTLSQVNTLRQHGDQRVSDLARRVFEVKPSSRPEVIRRYTPALSLRGSRDRGKTLFEQRCSACHRLEEIGHALGPDLVASKAGGREAIMISILDPNRDLQPNYLAYIVETKDGNTLVGLVVAESPSGVTLRQAFGAETAIARADIKAMRSQNESLMPQGIEEGLEPQDLADLLEFVVTAGDAPRP